MLNKKKTVVRAGPSGTPLILARGRQRTFENLCEFEARAWSKQRFLDSQDYSEKTLSGKTKERELGNLLKIAKKF